MFRRAVLTGFRFVRRVITEGMYYLLNTGFEKCPTLYYE
jgi:hypothetical protein